MTDAAGLISYLGTWVQLGGILLLLTLFRLLSRHAGTRSYFVIWAQAWLVLLLAVITDSFLNPRNEETAQQGDI